MQQGSRIVKTAILPISTHLGVGLYSYQEAAQLVRTSTGNIRRWANIHDELVLRQLDPTEQTLTFVELIELHFIKMFREQGVSLQVIRKTARMARKRFGSKYPFSTHKFDTDGHSIFGTLKNSTSSGLLLADICRGQLVFDTILKPFFRKLEYSKKSRELERYWPMTKRGRIVIDPARKFGKPIDSETGIPTRVIVNALNAGGGQSPAIVARWLGVPLRAVEAAKEFENSLAP